MPRPADPELRAALRDKIVAFVRANGVVDFSLRPVAAFVGVSPRTLLYHFGSREALLCEVFDTMRAVSLAQISASAGGAVGPRAALMLHWRWMAAPEQRPLVRLFYEMFGVSVFHADRFGTYACRVAEDWLTYVGAVIGAAPGTPDPRVSLIVSVFHGATLDLAATDDVPRLDAMMVSFLNGMFPGQGV
jgi:AcrR family transcriptional regulator